MQLVMNTTEGAQAVEDSRGIRSVALYDKIPYFTTAAALAPSCPCSLRRWRAHRADHLTGLPVAALWPLAPVCSLAATGRGSRT
jgi:hypothetical protein